MPPRDRVFIFLVKTVGFRSQVTILCHTARPWLREELCSQPAVPGWLSPAEQTLLQSIPLFTKDVTDGQAEPASCAQGLLALEKLPDIMGPQFPRLSTGSSLKSC
jgi:hypothetical protein